MDSPTFPDWWTLSVARRLQVLLAFRGCSAQEAAAAAGLSRHAVATLIARNRLGSLDTMRRVAIALECQLSHLVDRLPGDAAQAE